MNPNVIGFDPISEPIQSTSEDGLINLYDRVNEIIKTYSPGTIINFESSVKAYKSKTSKTPQKEFNRLPG